VSCIDTFKTPMPLFERPLAFRSSPLLPTVPLDGTQTVTGLRELERQSRLQAPQRHSRLAQPATSSNTRRTRSGPNRGFACTTSHLFSLCPAPSSLYSARAQRRSQ